VTNDEFTRLVQFLSEQFAGIDRRFEDVERRFVIIDRRFDDMNQRVEEFRSDVGGEFQRVRGKMREGFERVIDVDRRVRRLEEER
jgi:hypothetical protein